MFEDKETCCFMHLVYRFLHDDTYYLLHVKEYEKINPNKSLLGYYDNAYVYIIPSVLIGAIDNLGLATLFWTKLLRTRNYFNYSSYPADFKVFNPLYSTGVR